MKSIATLGPVGSNSYQAARQYDAEVDIHLFNSVVEVIDALARDEAESALIPVYNTRQGEIREYFRQMEQFDQGYWVDNVVLPIQLSLGVAQQDSDAPDITTIVGRGAVFKQCSEFITENYPDATLITVVDIEEALLDICRNNKLDHAVVESEELLRKHDMKLLLREIVPHNRTRFALLGKQLAQPTSYDATAIITRPLKDRVGMLVDILSEFTRRGINLLDMRSESDIKTQKLQIYIEAEGHIADTLLKEAIDHVERNVIQEENAIKLLGSFPRVDMRVKKIKSFGFIGTGDMSVWFADRLKHEGYATVLTGRSTALTPAEMISQVDVVVICVPISVTSPTVREYGKYLKDGQALILLAGESEQTLAAALEETSPGVEVMLVHNLWGPQAVTMKDKNASVVRTPRSGVFCSEFQAFLYKHGAEIYEDSAQKHDLLMGVGQKLPTTISVALAMTLDEHSIDYRDIGSHSTLTSLYGILAMARVHNQNPRTYAEIMTTSGEGRKIVRSFAENLLKVIDLAEATDIQALCQLMEANKETMPGKFLEARMKQAKAVDQILSESGVQTDW